MRNFKYKYLFVVLPLLITSCDKQLNSIKPQQSIDADAALGTSSGVINTLFGAYDRLQGGQLFGTDYNLVGELFAATSDLTFSGTFQGYKDIFLKNCVATNSESNRVWTRAYDAINICNNVLAHIDVVDATKKSQIEGEAKFIRAICYFELVRYFAQPWTGGPSGANAQLGVPVITTPTTSVGNELFVSRNSVKEVYTQILSDLDDAQGLLNETMDNGRATKYAAIAYLSRIYMAQGDWTKAANAADAVISSGNYTLVGSIANEFNNSTNTSEDIFAIQQTEQSNAGTSNDGMATFYASLPGVGRGDMNITSNHLTIYEDGDARKDLFYVGTGEKAGALRCSKWTDRYANIPIVRLAEMYLTRAEANFRASTAVGATPTSDINTIRSRAGLTTPVIVTSVDQILMERRRELAFEGDYYNTLKRTQANIGSKPYNDNKLILPIPQREMDANPNLVQNPGY